MNQYDIIIAGGGYSGISALLQLRKLDDSLRILLIDRNINFLRVTHLHKTVHTPLSDWQIPYSKLAEKYHFDFIHHDLEITPAFIEQFEAHKKIHLNGNELQAKALILTTGFSVAHEPPAGALSLSYLMSHDYQSIFSNDLKNNSLPGICIAGAGPTGLQFLFEIYDELRHHGVQKKLSLVFADSRVLGNWPRGYQSYVMKKITNAGIAVYDNSMIESITDHGVQLKRAGQSVSLPPSRVLFLTGVKPSPYSLECDEFGHVKIAHKTCSSVFAAGDASVYEGRGCNAMTAQAAVRKGRKAAANSYAMISSTSARAYDFNELGFFLSLGKSDGLGYMFFKELMVSGLPAFAIKEAIELQFDLFVSGFDTYPSFLL